MKLYFICIFTILMVENALCAMTEAQMKSAAKLIKNVCQPKTKVTNAQLDSMHKGEITQDPILMNYMECVLRTGMIVKDAKLNYESLKSQMANLPPSMSASGLVSVENCKDAIKSADKFIAAYEFYKCFYDDNPDNFFLP